jgi:hypothetical protein
MAESPPISFCTDIKALHMDWLKAASVVALGIMTAILTGAATAPETAAVVKTTTRARTISLNFPLILLSFDP